LTGEQFARPEALDLLRAIRRAGDAAEPAAVPTADPLNLAGIILPGARVSPLAMAIPIPTRKVRDRRFPWQVQDTA
jgi:ATP-dependent Lhr-like helicase